MKTNGGLNDTPFSTSGKNRLETIAIGTESGILISHLRFFRGEMLKLYNIAKKDPVISM